MRVAFIDDDPNELKILHTYFNDLTDSSTISIDDFSSGEEFLSRFTAGLYDLVILDIFMGDLTGVDVAHLRFSDVTTAILIVLLTIVQIWLGIWTAFFFHGNVGLISVASTALYYRLETTSCPPRLSIINFPVPWISIKKDISFPPNMRALVLELNPSYGSVCG